MALADLLGEPLAGVGLSRGSAEEQAGAKGLYSVLRLSGIGVALREDAGAHALVTGKPARVTPLRLRAAAEGGALSGLNPGLALTQLGRLAEALRHAWRAWCSTGFCDPDHAPHAARSAISLSPSHAAQ